MKILFCGSNTSLEMDTKIKYLSAAANRYQHNFIKALSVLGNGIEIFSYIGFPLEKGNREMIIRGRREFPVRYVFKEDGFLKSLFACRKLLKGLVLRADVAVAYNSLYAWFVLPYLCRKMNKVSVLILADYSGAEVYQGIIRKAYAWLMKNNIRKYDVVVGLSERTKRYLKQKQRFICSEGGIDETFYKEFAVLPEKDSKKMIFMYSGLLEQVTGIELLLRAFCLTEEADWELWISGRGSLDSMIVADAAKDNRIKFFGFLKYSEYIDRLKQADVLVNPRDMFLPENQNNFPSKILEYLATGKEIVSTRFVGAEKFERYISFCDSDVHELGNAMRRAAMDVEKQRELRYTQNREFAETYLWRKQAERIIRFIGGNK